MCQPHMAIVLSLVGCDKTNGKVRSRVTFDVALVGLRKAISWAVRRAPGRKSGPAKATTRRRAGRKVAPLAVQARER